MSAEANLNAIVKAYNELLGSTCPTLGLDFYVGIRVKADTIAARYFV